ncbi:MAG: GNAT family N-acetyltransferase [Deltaproteobacteria bacterium]|nr:MAG: GNAT family N-acetyltransferase [Deltaproteobacteria bacterium]
MQIIAEHNAAMARETEGIELDFDTVSRGVGEVLRNPGRGMYLLAEIDGRPVGQAMITFEWSDWRCADFWWLQSVYVRPEARRKGVFSTIFREVEKLAMEQGACGLRLYVFGENRRARSTYEALGMTLSHYVMYERSFDGGKP